MSESKCIQELSGPHTTEGHRRAHWHSTKSPLSPKSLSGDYLGTLRENSFDINILPFLFLLLGVFASCTRINTDINETKNRDSAAHILN